jgi:hypothetical protein
MVTLTDRQAVKMIADIDRLMRSANNNKDYNSLRKILLTLKKKQRYDTLHNRKDLRKR